jgi:dihydroorotate dehydrogenase (NAD+) catalytic subunit
MSTPLGRRLCEVIENRASGGYRVFSLIDETAAQPAAGQFYMLATETHWEQRGQRPFLPRALSVADADSCGDDVRLDFLIEGVGPGTDRLCELRAGEMVWVNGPLGNRFSEPRELASDAAGAILIGGGVGVAPLALLRRHLIARNVAVRVLLGFRDEAHCGGLDDLFSCSEVRLASEDGHRGHRGYVTELLAMMLDGDDSASAVVYACGPEAMLAAVQAMCGQRGLVCELAMESPMACGYGACFGCAVPRPGGGFGRLCLEGPVLGGDLSARPAAISPGGVAGRVEGDALDLTARPEPHPEVGTDDPERRIDFCGIELGHPVINASGTFDAIAALQIYGDRLLERFPFSAFVSKTITPEPRVGNEPQRIWETPAGMINSIGLPNKGLQGFLGEDLPRLAELPVPLVVSVMASTRAEFGRLVASIAEREEISAVELNVSCPNVDSGLIVGEQPAELLALVDALRPLSDKPLIVKLTPNVADPAALALAAEQAGADAVSLINTVKASAIDPLTLRAGIAAGEGGLSGPSVRPIAVAQVRSVAAAVELPIVGMGGICCGADASEFLAAGSTLVAVGTENFRDPLAGLRVAEELAARPLTRST